MAEWVIQHIGVPIAALRCPFIHAHTVRARKVPQRRIIEPCPIIHQATVAVQALAGEAHIRQAAPGGPLEGDLAVGLVVLALHHGRRRGGIHQQRRATQVIAHQPVLAVAARPATAPQAHTFAAEAVVVDRAAAQLFFVQPADIQGTAGRAAGGDASEQALAVGIVDIRADAGAVADAAQAAFGVEGAALAGAGAHLAAVGIVGVARAVVVGRGIFVGGVAVAIGADGTAHRAAGHAAQRVEAIALIRVQGRGVRRSGRDELLQAVIGEAVAKGLVVGIRRGLGHRGDVAVGGVAQRLVEVGGRARVRGDGDVGQPAALGGRVVIAEAAGQQVIRGRSATLE